ncbi:MULTISPECIES: metallophosphoesterase [Romboutsia]|uniref:metallophosphoesterase n=1 Tax=Romboutsia TaxID=1501226 RepID=UPI001F059298|nr:MULTISPECIES: metallophosphoesterase [Romboutsia]MCH1960386.1 metallophosphoesterase [Romboutsia hominis]MCH1969183.1 metallophosphoesterase [Romboutsia hominis]
MSKLFSKRKILWSVISISSLLIIGCSSTKSVDLNILATTDLHGIIPNEMVSYIEKQKKENPDTVVVDAGDFLDSGFGTSGDMLKYYDQMSKNYKNNNADYIEIPLAKEMKEAGFDTVTLGNHEFVSNNKTSLDNMISDFEKQGISILSANTYKKNGESYTKPYVIKEIKTPEGNIKLGILGLTLKEVGESKEWDGEKLVKAKSLELKDQKGYNGELYMNDLVEDANKWVKVMKEKDHADIIIAVAHSGERPKKPKHPGNRIQDLAQNVSGIDVIVAGHNHVQIKQHDYKNKDGQTVIVTEPGKHGECISKIDIKLKKDKNGWDVINKSSDIVQFKNVKKNLDMLCNNHGMFYGETSFLLDKGKEGKVISLKDEIPFKWDKMYIFKPGTPRDEIYKKAGYKFLNIAESDDMYQFIIMDKEKVICYSNAIGSDVPTTLKFDNADFKDNCLTIIPGENDYFKVSKGEKEKYIDRYKVILNYEKKEN